MKPIQLLPLLATALLIGWFAPGLPSDADHPGKASANQADDAASLAAMHSKDGWLAGQTVLRREDDGHFYADAYIDGGSYRFLVDTGASVIALTGSDAEAMGLEWDEAQLKPIGKGASGTVYGVATKIPHIEVGGFEAQNVPATIIPEGLHVSLLGQSFLSRIDNVEISGDEMRLGG